ncbi:MAG: dTMP kinase, partial [Nitrososphaeraceae archaeon]
QMLSHYLREEKHLNTAHFDLPDYQTDVGKLIDKYLNYVEMPPNPEVLHLLYAANRYEIRDVINFHLNDGYVVIMNRYYQSNIVYGYVNGLEIGWLSTLDENMPQSDLTIILDVPTQITEKRGTLMNENRFANAKDFIEKVREAFLTLAEKEEWKVIDATRSKEDIHKDIIRIVENFIGS